MVYRVYACVCVCVSFCNCMRKGRPHLSCGFEISIWHFEILLLGKASQHSFNITAYPNKVTGSVIQLGISIASDWICFVALARYFTVNARSAFGSYLIMH